MTEETAVRIADALERIAEIHSGTITSAWIICGIAVVVFVLMIFAVANK